MFDKITNSNSHINLILSSNGLAFEEYKKTIDLLGRKLDGSKRIHETHFMERRKRIELNLKKVNRVFFTTLIRDIAIEIIDCVKKMKLENSFSCFYFGIDNNGEIKLISLDFEGTQYLLKETSEDSSYRMV